MGLVRFSQSYRPAVSWKLYSTQLQYVLFELRNKFNLANSKLLQTTDIESASNVFNKYYLETSSGGDQIARRAYEEVLNS
jgi:hypothetical protein